MVSDNDFLRVDFAVFFTALANIFRCESCFKVFIFTGAGAGSLCIMCFEVTTLSASAAALMIKSPKNHI